METLKTILRSIRAKKNLTQGYVAYKLGISQSQYNKLENGEVPFTLDKLVNIIPILGVDKSEFISEIFELKSSLYYAPGLNNKDNNTDYYKQLAEHYEKKFLDAYKENLEMHAKNSISNG